MIDRARVRAKDDPSASSQQDLAVRALERAFAQRTRWAQMLDAAVGERDTIIQRQSNQISELTRRLEDAGLARERLQSHIRWLEGHQSWLTEEFEFTKQLSERRREIIDQQQQEISRLDGLYQAAVADGDHARREATAAGRAEEVYAELSGAFTRLEEHCAWLDAHRIWSEAALNEVEHARVIATERAAELEQLLAHYDGLLADQGRERDSLRAELLDLEEALHSTETLAEARRAEAESLASTIQALEVELAHRRTRTDRLRDVLAGKWPR
ncbi:MAG: hypothetical protein U0821_21100 [Chloroflexota bacterium]